MEGGRLIEVELYFLHKIVPILTQEILPVKLNLTKFGQHRIFNLGALVITLPTYVLEV